MIEEDVVVAGQSADEQPSAVPEKPDAPEVTKRVTRDEGGKFAKVGEPSAEQQQDAPRDEGGKQIPIQALDAEKARRRKAEQESHQLRGYLQALQQQPKPAPTAQQEPEKPLPDWYAEPDKAFDARMERVLKPILEKLEAAGASPRQAIETTSRQIAIDRHGTEVVQEAFNAANERMGLDPAFNAAMKARLNASDHPFGELIKWHKEQSALSRFGDDPEAAFEAEVERRLAERMGQQPAGHAQQRAPVLPPTLPSNFANARNAGGNRAPAYGGPKPLNEIFGR
jgi:hypothetical protein